MGVGVGSEGVVEWEHGFGLGMMRGMEVRRGGRDYPRCGSGEGRYDKWVTR